MSLRCPCTDRSDVTVFGQCPRCNPEPQEPRERPWEITLDESERRD